MNLQTLQERQDKLTAQRAQLLEEANRQLAMIDGALALLNDMIAEMSAGDAADEEE
ncbi:hypothetical protein [Thauera sp.]|uniref:hypothetical protein n=1 Tax=Thauera sp. TaxID=1905334 RepID=UPI002BA387C7|nr:hypothetical protein [Thauera sp.]HRP26644.1 hypothetical protein [Thauera sp.]